MTDELILLLQQKLNKESGAPIYKELGDLFAQMIEEGAIKPDEKLPPIRKLAGLLCVNNITAVNAYKYLENKKYVYSVAGSGTYVAEIKAFNEADSTFEGIHTIEFRNSADIGNAEVVNFANATTSANLFPVDEFKRLFNSVLDRDMGDAFGYEESQGYLPLREALCDYMGGVGIGIKSAPDRIQVISGAQQGIDIIAKAMLMPGDSVIVETPTYYGAVASFMSRGANVAGAPILEDGIDISKLEALVKIYRPKLVYVMPYFQTPTCYSYSIEKKRKLLGMAQKYDFYIIEEDNQSDFNYSENPVTPLKALDYKNRVIYIKSFSKILMPGLRLGFMALPKNVLNRVVSAKHTADIDTSGFIQRAFELFIRNGEWDRHIFKMKQIYQARYEVMYAAVKKNFKARLGFLPPEGGLNFWISLPERINPTEFCERLYRRGIVVTPGSLFALNNEELKNIRLSFANLKKADIERGIKQIADEYDGFVL